MWCRPCGGGGMLAGKGRVCMYQGWVVKGVTGSLVWLFNDFCFLGLNDRKNGILVIVVMMVVIH